jgi:hypothetical protein
MSVKVTMNLTDKDVANTEGLQSLTGSRTKAQAVSTALSVTKLLAQKMSEGGEVFIKTKDGGIEKLVIPEMI